MNLIGNFSSKFDKEIARFLAAYNKVKDQDDRLDAAASLMGWHRDDWSSTDEIELEDNDFPIIKSLDIDDLNNIDPYTIHKTPNLHFIKRTFSYLRASWERLMQENKLNNEPNLIWG